MPEVEPGTIEPSCGPQLCPRTDQESQKSGGAWARPGVSEHGWSVGKIRTVRRPMEYGQDQECQKMGMEVSNIMNGRRAVEHGQDQECHNMVRYLRNGLRLESYLKYLGAM